MLLRLVPLLGLCFPSMWALDVRGLRQFTSNGAMDNFAVELPWFHDGIVLRRLRLGLLQSKISKRGSGIQTAAQLGTADRSMTSLHNGTHMDPYNNGSRRWREIWSTSAGLDLNFFWWTVYPIKSLWEVDSSKTLSVYCAFRISLQTECCQWCHTRSCCRVWTNSCIYEQNYI